MRREVAHLNVQALTVLWMVTAGAALHAHGVGAQAVAEESGSSHAIDEVVPSAGGGFAIFGRTPDRARVVPALWVLHPFKYNFPEAERVRGGGLQFSTWYAGVFVNSYGSWSVIAAVERDWYVLDVGWLDLGVGYRAGLMTGYDERLLEIAGDLPALPIGGPLLWIRVGPVGVDALYVYRAISIEGSIGF